VVAVVVVRAAVVVVAPARVVPTQTLALAVVVAPVARAVAVAVVAPASSCSGNTLTMLQEPSFRSWSALVVPAVPHRHMVLPVLLHRRAATVWLARMALPVWPAPTVAHRRSVSTA
jgi:hypothetical protein